MTLKDAALEAAGVDQSTLWRWRQEDPAFDAAVQELQNQVDEIRTAMVEDTVFGQIISGEASPALTLAYLYNRAPHRWRRNPEQAGGADDGKIPVEVLRRIMAHRSAQSTPCTSN